MTLDEFFEFKEYIDVHEDLKTASYKDSEREAER